ncbi:MAG: GTPase HflX [candidate division TA06 bacterium ADurb.Bin417]|uniref:GTPase HflX n=1 Tax=candidate division TA06 bacterium ADurb.Bin417 TaxID=1852828 RepID=A0A1V5MH97_UNCT6|nr:MAG: GTPase HflX [candidate division TA06 bacterium ADurb.Bin417]
MSEVKADRQPALLVVNKIDQLDGPDRERLTRKLPEARLVSARTGEGIPGLREDIFQRLWTP